MPSDTTEDNSANASTDPDAALDDASEDTDDTHAATEASSDPANFNAAVSAPVIQETIEIVEALVDECRLHFTEDSLQIRAVDPANVAMVDLELDAAGFETYNGTNQTVGISIERFSDIAGMAESDQLMKLQLREDRRLNVSMGGLSYNVALIDSESVRDEPDIPDLDLSSRVTLEGAEIDRGVTAADMVSQHIRLSTDEAEETFRISATGDTDDVELELDREEDLINMQAGPADSMFSLDYLKEMVSPLKPTAAVTADLGEEFPAKFHFEYAEGDGTVTYMLAPRIQND